MGKARISGHELIAGRYRLLDVVHQETNRVIWHGQDTGKGTARQCLLTRIELPADHDSEQAQRAADRMARRSQTMARICPGRVVPVLDAVTEVGALWTVTEWIDGLPLGRILEQKGALSPARAAAIGLELLDVLEAAHGEGITRGELSPGQVFVRKRGPAVVTGFGLTGATLAARVATPAYASPEQVKNERIGPASDLWALGAILYTMIEGRPPYRDLGLPETTPDSVDQLPLQAGNFDSTALGLLRTNSRERLTRTAVREALARLPQETPQAVLAPQPRPARILARLANLRWNEQSVTVGTALAILTAVVAALAVTHQPPGTETPADTSAQTAPSAIPTSSGQDGADTENKATPAPVTPPPGSAQATPSAPSSPSASTDNLPSGYLIYCASEGFSIALPTGWQRLKTSKDGDNAYRATFGAADDPRTLAVTYTQGRVRSGPVAVWRDDVEPSLQQEEGYRRIGAIQATTYQGYRAADMEWAVVDDGTPLRTFGQGLLLGGGRSFSLRWTTPAADWDRKANRQALETFLRTFRPDPTG